MVLEVILRQTAVAGPYGVPFRELTEYKMDGSKCCIWFGLVGSPWLSLDHKQQIHSGIGNAT